MNPSHRRPAFVLVVAAVLLWGCSSSRLMPSPTQVPSPASSTAPPNASMAAPTAVAPPSPFPTEGPIEPSIADGIGESDVDSLLNTVVITVSDRVRVRSEPRVSDDSIKYEPVLPLNTELLVLDGPVSASGYRWYKVAPVSFDGLEGPGSGWVAMEGTDGEPWVRTCPPRPDRAALASMGGNAGLACYGDQEFTFTARLFPNDGLDWDDQVEGDDLPEWLEPWWTEPLWLSWLAEDFILVSLEDLEADYWFVVKLDPAIDRATLPDFYDGSIWTAVEVTGQYDHPEARTCRGKSVPKGEQPPEPEAVVASCRSQFVVTAISPL